MRILLVFLMGLGISCSRHNPCDEIDDSTEDGRAEKAYCEVGQYLGEKT